MAYRVVAYRENGEQPYPTYAEHRIRVARKLVEFYWWLDETVGKVILVDAVTGAEKEVHVRGA